MSSRRSSPATLTKSNPRENDPTYRGFLARSIDRCDVELGALVQLNRQLALLKNKVIEQCGVETLLYMGQGKLTLNADGDDLVEVDTDTNHTSSTTSTTGTGTGSHGSHVGASTGNATDATTSITTTTTTSATINTSDAAAPTTITTSSTYYKPSNPDDIGVCLDFLLRMKLRKKLMNRLARRIHRLNCAFDGQDVFPPGPPKYGDLRLHIDQVEVQKYAETWKRQAEAKEKIQHAREIQRKEVKDRLDRFLAQQQQQQQQEDEQQAEEKKEEEEEEETAEEPLEKEQDDKDDNDDDNDNDNDDQEMKDPASSSPLLSSSSSPKETGTDKPAEPVPLQENGTAAAAEPTTTSDKTKTASSPSAPPKQPPQPDQEQSASSSNVPFPNTTPSNEQHQQQHPLPPSSSSFDLEDDFALLKEYKDTYQKEVFLETGQTKYTILDDQDGDETNNNNNINANHGSGIGIGATHRSMSTREKEAEWQRWSHALLGSIPEQPTVEELGVKNQVFLLQERLQVVVNKLQKQHQEEQEAKEAAEALKLTPQKAIKKKDDGDTSDDDDDDFDDDDMTPQKSNKTPDKKDTSARKNKKTKKPIKKKKKKKDSDEEDVSDEMEIDEEDELLSDSDDDDDDDFDPDNDDDDGDDDDDDDDEKEKKKKKKKTKSTSTPKKTPTKGKNEPEGLNNKSPGKSLKSPNDKDNKKKKGDGDDDKGSDDSENSNKENKKTSFDEPFKKRKQMSVNPIPSFYEQDRRRILMIHADLMANSMHEHARTRIAEVTNEYNASFRRSNEIYNRRVQVQTSLNNILYESRIKGNKMKSDYELEVALARGRWLKCKEIYEQQKIKSLLPSYRGQVPMGTPRTAAASVAPDQIKANVAQALANVVDACVMIAESPMQMGKFEPFVIPPPTDPMQMIVDFKTRETFGQRQQRLETSMRMDLNSLTARLGNAEEERKRAWRKMLKTRSEFEPEYNSRGRKNDPNGWQHVPVPNLRGSGAASMPTSFSYVAPAIPTYTPPASTGLQVSSESKYSMAKVKERIAADGTVAPVTQPKRNLDGTFQRPAGRTRKGMEWDAIRGIWVPDSQLKNYGK